MLIVYILSAILFFMIIRRLRGNGNVLSVSLLLLYLGSFISTIILDIYIKQDVLVIPSLFLLFIIVTWIVPFDGINISTRSLINIGKKEYYLGIFFCFILIPATFFWLDKFLILLKETGFQSNIKTTDNAKIAYSTMFGGFLEIMTNLYFIPLFLFFISLIKKWSVIFSILLLIASFSMPLCVLSIYGRDGVIFWTINFFIFYRFFALHLSRMNKLLIRSSFFVILGGILFGLVVMSLTRFDVLGNGDYYLLQGTLGYYGQQLQNFSDVFYVDANYVGSIFPSFSAYFYKFLGYDTNLLENSKHALSDVLNQANIGDEINVFAFFVKELYFAFGYFGAILFSIFVYTIVNNLIILFSKTLSFYYIFIVILLFQFPMCGVFYYRQGIGRGDLAYFIFFCLLFLWYKTDFLELFNRH